MGLRKVVTVVILLAVAGCFRPASTGAPHATRCSTKLPPAAGTPVIVHLGPVVGPLHAVAPVFLLPGQVITVIGPPPMNIPDPIPTVEVRGILCQAGKTAKLVSGSRTVFVAEKTGTVMVGVSQYYGGPTADFDLFVCVVVHSQGVPADSSACK